jgi:PIN domain nuclease of toxin-antitoxin system
MIAAVADTHALIWYLGADTRLSVAALEFIENVAKRGDQIAISAISLIEMVYLLEKGRIPSQRFSQIASELEHPNSLFVEVPIDLAVARALTRVDVFQIPDMPDRIIAATAVHLQVPLISRDRKIQLSPIETLW